MKFDVKTDEAPRRELCLDAGLSRFIFTVALAILGASCAEDISTSPIDASCCEMDAEDAGGAGADAEQIEDSGADLEDAEPHMDAIQDWYQDPGVVRPLSFYECDENDGRLNYGRPLTAYLPGEPYEFEPISYEYFEARRGSAGDTGAVSSAAAAPHVNANGFMTVVNHSVGEDFDFRHGFVFGSDPDPDNAWISTVLVDYRPVTATFRFPDDLGNEILPEQGGSGFLVRWDRDVGVVDVSIPGSNFPEPGYYEVLVRHAVRRPGAYPYELAKRTTVWVETNERRPHPCFERAEPPTPLPTDLGENIRAANLGFDRHVMLVPRDIVEPADLNKEVVVAPGQTVEFDYYVVGVVRPYEEWGFPEVILPAVNGEPIGEAEYYMTELPLGLEPYDVMHRGSFSYTVPEEPGIYDVEMIQAVDAYIPFMNWSYEFNLYPYPARIGGANQHQGSHIIRLRVPG